MSPGLLLVLMLQAADADGLALARDAFARGDYAAAASLALEAAHPPEEGAALYLAGLAQFRAGRPAEALTALDAAALAADAPPRPEWQFNRAACLYEVGRFAEAEGAYLESAAAAPTLAPVALANAAFAALDDGNVQRAAELGNRARALDSAVARPLLDDLDAQLAHLRSRAAVAKARDALASGDRVEARHLAREALETPLEPPDAAGARAILDATTPGLAARGMGWDLVLRLGAAYDSNVLQSGLRSGQDYIPIATGQVRSAALLGSATLAYRSRWQERLTLEAAYGLDQLTYLAGAAEDYGVQQHTLALSGEWSATASLRAGASVVGQWTFTGLSSFRSLQGALGGAVWAAYDETDATTTRLEAAWTRKAAASAEFAYLTGNRLDLAATQQLRIGSGVLELGYRYRDERIGTLALSSTAALRNPGCMMGGCPIEYSEPFGYAGHALFLGARTPLGPVLQVGAYTGLEWRTYAEDTVLRITSTAMMGTVVTQVDRRRREDRRFLAAVHGTARLAPWLSLTARYDLVVNGSTIENAYDDRNYTKHVVSVETVFTW